MILAARGLLFPELRYLSAGLFPCFLPSLLLQVCRSRVQHHEHHVERHMKGRFESHTKKKRGNKASSHRKPPASRLSLSDIRRTITVSAVPKGNPTKRRREEEGALECLRAHFRTEQASRLETGRQGCSIVVTRVLTCAPDGGDKGKAIAQYPTAHPGLKKSGPMALTRSTLVHHTLALNRDRLMPLRVVGRTALTEIDF